MSAYSFRYTSSSGRRRSAVSSLRPGPIEGPVGQPGPSSGGDMEENAQVAHALFVSLAERSVAHRLPMKLDY